MKSWYLVHSKPKEEELAKEHLKRQSYQVYLPKIFARKRQSGRIIRAIQPMFPRYLFINLSDETDDWGPIRSTIGVSTLVRFGMEPAKVPENIIIKLKENENTNGYHDLPEKTLSIGDKVIIAEGPFEGYAATLFSKNSDERVVVLLKIAENHLKLQLKQSLINPLQ
jgi:transcriptional antiterminator RfaH